MAGWITHLMIADTIMERFSGIDRRGFCVGSIAPDCNVENEDWTAFTPPREITHWMRADRKADADAERFREAYLLKRRTDAPSAERFGFLLGYYAHLITDASCQRFIRDEERVRRVWARIKADETMRERAVGLPETWDSVKLLVPKSERLRAAYATEAEYLLAHPNSGYVTEILPLKEFPDYLDYLPHGCIVRKIGVMGHWPKPGAESARPIAITREEYQSFVDGAIDLVSDRFLERQLV